MPRFIERPELIPPNQTLLFSEPIFKNPSENETQKLTYKVPLGSEEQLLSCLKKIPSERELTNQFKKEYLSMAYTLRAAGAAFRIIIAHRDQIDESFAIEVIRAFGVRGLALDPAISSTCFPRDMMVDFDGDVFINTYANIEPGATDTCSPLGEGGMILKSGKKIFAADHQGFIKTKKIYREHIRKLSNQFRFGFLPFPLASEINTDSCTTTIFNNPHIDRVSAFIRGKDGEDYLLLDRHYAEGAGGPWGRYWPHIYNACKTLQVRPEVIDSQVPYGLNLIQFNDDSVVMTGGSGTLEKIIKEIVGEDKVAVTPEPIVFYPLIRQGGFRCMTLFAPQKIVGSPVVPR